MALAYEFKDPSLKVIKALSPDEVGYWLAFFKYKAELESPKQKKIPTRESSGKGIPKRLPKRGK